MNCDPQGRTKLSTIESKWYLQQKPQITSMYVSIWKRSQGLSLIGITSNQNYLDQADNIVNHNQIHLKHDVTYWIKQIFIILPITTQNDITDHQYITYAYVYALN